MDETKILVERFIKLVKDKYPTISMDFHYNHDEDIFEIWYDDERLEFGDINFQLYVGNLIKEVLYDNDVFNFSFIYNYQNVILRIRFS